MSKSISSRAASFALREIVGEFLYWPVWWYSGGLVLTWRRLQRSWWAMVARTGLRFLLANMGKPMYGDYTRSGRIISFFFRLFLVGWWSWWLLVWTIVEAAALIVWLGLPVLVLGLLIRQLIPA